MRISTLALFFAFARASAQTPSPEWGFTLDGAGGDDVELIATGSDGSVTVVGSLGGIVDMDPGVGSQALDPGSANTATYVARYDSSGALAWAFALLTGSGGNEDFDVSDLAVATDGSFYLAIELNGTVELAPLGSSVSVAATSIAPGYSNAQDLVLAAYANDGSYDWHRHMKGNSARLVGDEHMHLALRDQGEVLVCGAYYGSIDLDQTVVGTSDSLHIAALNPHAYVVQYASDGTFEWAFDYDDASRIQGMADAQPGVLVSLGLFGVVPGTSDLDPGPGVVLGNNGANHLLKYDASFNLVSSLELDAEVLEVITTGQNEFAWVATFEGTTTVGDSTYSGFGSGHTYVACLRNTPPYLWSRYFELNNPTARIAALNDGSLLVALDFDDPIDLDGQGTEPGAVLTPIAEDIAVAHYTSTGAFVHAWHIGTVDDWGSPLIALDDADNLFLAAQLQGTVDVDPGSSIMNLSATAGGDGGLLVKYNMTTSVNILEHADAFSVWPVPTDGVLNFRPPGSRGIVRWEVVNAVGHLVDHGRCSAFGEICTLDLHHMLPGTYALRVLGEGQQWCSAFVRK